jgi:endonuclease/exonuclease/phosphatase family metal-dependent hydrolase
MSSRVLKVASYNIRKSIGTDRKRRPDRILDVLAELDADIVALQEADRRFGQRAAALPPALLQASPWRAVELSNRHASIGWHGNAILVRRDAEVVTYAHIDLPTVEPRGAVMAEVRTHGVRVRVVGMHLDLSGLRRRMQVRAICDALAVRRPLPTILMGDLNEWNPHGACLREFGNIFRIVPTPPSFHSRRPIARLDRIITDRSVRIMASGVHSSETARRASDHLPVWARLEFEGISR